MKEYNAYLFDADGTLMDTRELIFRSFLHMGEEMGAGPLSHDLIHGTTGLPLVKQMRLILGEGKGDDYYARARDVYNGFMMSHLDEYLRSFPGAVETVGELHRRGKKLAVVTSRRLPSAQLFLDRVGLKQFFDVFVTPESTEKHKPEPEPALLAMHRLGAKPEETVFVGDAIFDIKCGKSAGTDTVFVTWGGMDPSEWEVRPDWTVERFEQLIPEFTIQ